MPIAKYYANENEGIPPYAILYVGSQLKKVGYDVSIYHGSEIREILKLIRRDEVFAGLSAFTGYPVKIACVIAKEIKKIFPNLPTVLGGYHATLLKEQVLQDDFFDFICIGEGEETAIELADWILKKETNFGNILGLGWKDPDKKIHINEKRPIPKNIDFHIDEELANWHRYTPKIAHLGNKKLLYIFSSRGCPFYCSFCAGSFLYNRRYRKQSADHVISQYKPIIEKYKVDVIEYLDDNFFVDLGWAEHVARGLGVPYRALMRIDRVNEQVCNLLNQTGCRAIFTGIESGNDKVRLDIMDKRITNDQIRRGLALLREKCPQINISAMFIAGIPGESYQQFRDTCKFAMEVTKINPRVMTQCNVYAPYPYCKSYEEAVKAGWKPPTRTEDWILDSKQGSDLYPVWLNWKTKDPKKLKRKFDLTANMFMLLREENEHLTGLKKLAKRILEICARFRLKYDLYFLPLEIDLFWKLYRRFVKSDIILDNKMKTWGQGDSHIEDSASLKIAHFIISLNPGGAEAMLMKLLPRLDKHKFQNFVISMMQPEGKTHQFLSSHNIPLYSLDMKQGRPTFKSIFKLIRLLKKEKPQILQTWLYKADLLGLIFGKLARVSHIIWNIRRSHSDPKEHNFIGRIVFRTCALLSRFPGAVVVNSVKGKDSHQVAGYHPKMWSVIPNGFDTDKFRPDSEARFKIREELNIGSERFVIGMIARLVPIKNHQLFFQAACLLLQTCPDTHFILCGRGVSKNNSSLIQLIPNQLSLNQFHLLGERHDIPQILSALDILSLTSSEEGFPNVIGEAMACGVPCVATDVGTINQLIHDVGSVVPPDDPNSLCGEWIRLIKMSHQERKDLGLKARERIKDHYDIKDIALKYECFYHKVSLAQVPWTDSSDGYRV